MQREITEPGPLLDAGGRLRTAGWARRPHLDANLERAAPGLLRRLRVKRWDYYGIWTPSLFASATLSDIGYAGLAFVYVVDLTTDRHAELTRVRPLAWGIDLPRNSDAGDIEFDDGRIALRFTVKPESRHLDVVAPRFDGGRGLRIDVDLACPADHESIVIATPMGGDRFYYNRKINCMRAEGLITWGDRTVRTRPDQSLGQLDWGRGVWPYRTRWIWASANGFLPDGRTLGLNLGAGFGDLSNATENAVLVDGRLHKLGTVRFDFDPANYRRPWHCEDDEGRLRLKLTPLTERVAATRAGVIRSEVHQMFGRYTGTAVTEGGETIPVRDLPGFAEEHYARW